MIRLFCILLMGIFLPGNLIAQTAGKNENIHPRGIITAKIQDMMREKMKEEPYKSLLVEFENQTLENINSDKRIITRATAYKILQNMLDLAFLHVLTGNPVYADKAKSYINQCSTDSLFWLNPVSFGLSRARFLRNCALTYDLCYNSWDPEQNKQISKRLIDCAFSIQSTFGFDANYALESNWMGVRYGAVFLATLVADDFNDNPGYRSPLNALNWDSRERLHDHINVNINPGGWSAESLGYHFFAWSFITPAIAAFQNGLRGNHRATLESYAPHALKSVGALISSIVNIKGSVGRGIKADLSDDNMGVSPEFFLQALSIYPSDQQGIIKWVIDYLQAGDNPASLFYRAAYYPDGLIPQNPSEKGLLNFADSAQGAIVFRNRFENENDIVATFTSTSKRVRAHQSGDNLTFRIIGLDNIWATGAGRTGLYAGQTNLFPGDSVSIKGNHNSAVGKLLEYKFFNDGSGYAIGSGSCMGVEDHQRIFRAEYSESTGTEAVFIVQDHSTNGKIWRLNTPEFNTVRTTGDGFIIEGPAGSTLKATVFNGMNGLTVKTSRIRYGGDTKENVAGIGYKGKTYYYTTAIDCPCNGNIIVIMTLQPKGQSHPPVRMSGVNLFVGAEKLRLD